MEFWRQCAMWLIKCRVLPENHRVTWESAQVCDLAQTLRDGVLLCQLLNKLLPQAVNLREINLRPQMSQFLCLKNIRTFLGVCQEKFHLKKSELFEAFDLFDVRDFAKVIDTLSILSHSSISIQKGIQPFPLEACTPDDEIYSGLSDHIDDTVDEDDDLYDFVEDEEEKGDEIYEDLMRTDEPPETVSSCLSVSVSLVSFYVFNLSMRQQKTGVDKRECCLQEIRQTEEKYSDTLESILQHFMKPLEKFLTSEDIESIFINIEDLANTHRDLLEEVRRSILSLGAVNLHQVFLNYKERLLLYGRYCSQVETATKHLDKLSSTKEDIKMKLEECSKRANSGRFSLRDLLMVPMQRVLKYHLLLQELVKHTTDPTNKENLRTALDAMRDLAQCVNEVKRDNEIIRQITTFQLSIENMSQSLALFGRPKIDGELKICSSERKSKQDRHAFLFDKAMFVCKKKSGETFELKEIVELQHYQLRDEISGDKAKKWSYLFLLLDCYGRCGYDLYFKTRELKKKWLEQFEMALSNMCPDNATANNHNFQMHCFEDTTYCRACSMLLRFAGNMDRNTAKNLLMPRSDGTFLVRQKDGGEFAISIKFNMDIKHIKITSADALYRINDKKAFKCLIVSCLTPPKPDSHPCHDILFIIICLLFPLQEMIQFYQHNSLKEYFKDVDTVLCTPFKQPEQSSSPNNPASCTPGFMQSVGTARARYDFSARDRLELSLREGDTVKIISKKGHSGWWKGEVYGRVGFFPANYVKEDYSDYC
ncbi:unnamed protein product [Lampetra planeri]